MTQRCLGKLTLNHENKASSANFDSLVSAEREPKLVFLVKSLFEISAEGELRRIHSSDTTSTGGCRGLLKILAEDLWDEANGFLHGTCGIFRSAFAWKGPQRYYMEAVGEKIGSGVETLLLQRLRHPTGV